MNKLIRCVGVRETVTEGDNERKKKFFLATGLLTHLHLQGQEGFQEPSQGGDVFVLALLRI